MDKNKLPTLEEIRNARPILRNPVEEVRFNLTPMERFALYTTRHVGSMGFFFLLALWTLLWLLWNVMAPIEMRFDPAPAFVIWLFISNLIQLILLPLVMVGQNLESKVTDERAQADFEVNQKAENEIEVVIAHLENQNEILKKILERN